MTKNLSALKRPRYPLGEQSFQSIREDGKVYVDKTELIFDLINNIKYVFLAQPRRFGKSLLLSTIQAYFEGKKELFRDLAVYNLEHKWGKYPVLHLELSKCDPGDSRSLVSQLSEQFQIWEKLYGVKEIQDTPGARFTRIIRNAFETTWKNVFKLGINFSSKTRNIDSFIVKS